MAHTGTLFGLFLTVMISCGVRGSKNTTISLELGNGLYALKAKIEAEQIQVENSDQLQRIINLADEIIMEAEDAVGELAIAGELIELDAQQASGYCEHHVGEIKSIAYKLWKDGKNTTLNIEDVAEYILDTEAGRQMLEDNINEYVDDAIADSFGRGVEEESRARRSATTASAAMSTPVVDATEAANETLNTTVMDTTPTPVNVEKEARKIIRMAEHLMNEFDRELRDVINLAGEIKVVYQFQAYQISTNVDAVDETKEDVADSAGEILENCDKVIDTATLIIRENTKAMDLITEYASSVRNKMDVL